jgi:hypothetical protein
MLLQVILAGLFYKVMHPLENHPWSHFLTFFVYPAFLTLTLIFYLLAAYTNPGYIIGDEKKQLAKAQEHELKHNRAKSR